MLARQKTYLFFAILLVGFVCAEEDEIEGEDPVPHSVRVESCAGWRLNKLPEVKKFIQVRKCQYSANYSEMSNGALTRKKGGSITHIFIAGRPRDTLS